MLGSLVILWKDLGQKAPGFTGQPTLSRKDARCTAP